MKKTLIALAVTATAVATGANANELYNQDGTTLEMGGRAEARLSIKDGKADDASRVRLNFLGKTMINDSLYGVGFYEGEYTTNDRGVTDAGSDIDHRYLYAGVGGKFGEVSYGKTAGALGVITDFTDIMAYHGNSAAEKLGVADRVDDMIAYQGQFSDLALQASYRFADRTEEADGYGDDGQDGFSLSTIYAFGESGFKLGGGYAEEGDADEFMVAASYAISDFYFAGTFTDGSFVDTGADLDYTGYEFAAAYTLGKTVFTTTYNNAEVDGNNAHKLNADNIAIDATYYFKPNFRTYISYNFNLLDKDDVGYQQAEDEIALGMRYDF